MFGCRHAENDPIHRKMVVDCPLVITSKVKLFLRPDKTRTEVQPVFCLVDIGSCYLYLLQEAVARGKSGITTARNECAHLNLKLIFLRLPLPYESLDLRVNKWK